LSLATGVAPVEVTDLTLNASHRDHQHRRIAPSAGIGSTPDFATEDRSGEPSGIEHVADLIEEFLPSSFAKLLTP